MGKVNLYIGTGYTVETGCNAIISCAGKLHSNCKFFPPIGEGASVIILLVADDCGVTYNSEMNQYIWWDGKWQKQVGYHCGSDWCGWNSSDLSSAAVRWWNGVVHKVVLSGCGKTPSIEFEPSSRFFMFGYVPVAMRPESEWGKTESAWIQQWLEHTYGRTD